MNECPSYCELWGRKVVLKWQKKQLQFIIWLSDKLYFAHNNHFRSYSILETSISILCPFFRKAPYFDALVTQGFWHISDVHFLWMSLKHFRFPFFQVFYMFKISGFFPGFWQIWDFRVFWLRPLTCMHGPPPLLS